MSYIKARCIKKIRKSTIIIPFQSIIQVIQVLPPSSSPPSSPPPPPQPPASPQPPPTHPIAPSPLSVVLKRCGVAGHCQRVKPYLPLHHLLGFEAFPCHFLLQCSRDRRIDPQHPRLKMPSTLRPGTDATATRKGGGGGGGCTPETLLSLLNKLCGNNAELF